ncbi:MAG: orotidine-5'-phosphate decarboxylase [Geminicoccaceae bacterium]
MSSSTNPIFCAVDRPDLDGATALARAVLPAVGGLKLGLEFVTANGPTGVMAVRATGCPIFLDLKFHDIPNTVAGAVRSAAALDVAMLTLHAAGGRTMLKAAVDAAKDTAHRPWLLAVTVLTSFDQDDLAATGVAASLSDQVLRLTDLALSAGVDGIVCSPHEIALLRRAHGTGFKLVVPGIRAAGGGDDQKRTMAPAEALAAGADILVVGRPITQAPSPAEAARALLAQLKAAA